ncbi:MAG TPA: hypothetical protein VD994_06780, partial [Prosthecobacter sp.]|nr:hypothetical protein [Prosthecobacter sp.]
MRPPKLRLHTRLRPVIQALEQRPVRQPPRRVMHILRHLPVAPDHHHRAPHQVIPIPRQPPTLRD